MNVGPKLKYRAFGPADSERLQNLIWKVIEVSYRDDYSQAARDFFKSFHSADRVAGRAATGTVLVAELSGRIVATASLSGCEIFAVFVDPDQQGKGYGRRLMKKMEDIARASGVAEIHLSVSLPSKRFYESLGYVITQPRERKLENGELLRFWSARKLLNKNVPSRSERSFS